MDHLERPQRLEDVNWFLSLPFLLIHVVAVVGVFLVPPTLGLVAVAAISYLVRMWGLTAGFHRYFSHRSFKTSRVFQFFLALLGTLSVQKGVLWWAGHHREHHRHSDREHDRHSPTLGGFFWAHVGWFLCSKHDETPYDKIRDFSRYPELMWLNRYFLPVQIAAGALLWWVAGFEIFIWAGMIGTVVLWHGTFTINSLAHLFGRRRYKTRDHSRNNWLLAIITLGEGWHNNHHYYPGSVRQGFYWWEVDVAYYVLKGLSWLGIVWDLNPVPERVLEKGRAPAGDAVSA